MSAHEVVKTLVAAGIHPSPEGYSEDGGLTFIVGQRGGPCWVQVDVDEVGIMATEMTWREVEDEEGEEGDMLEFEDEADDTVDLANAVELVEYLQSLGFGPNE